MRWLSLDVGEKRIGVAVSDETGTIAQPIGMIERVGWGPDIEKIAAYASQYGTNALVVGLPLTLGGARGPQAEKTLAFAEQLTKKGFEVALWDERMTTVTAERALIEGGVRREKRRETVDQVAAAIILQAFLDAGRNP